MREEQRGVFTILEEGQVPDNYGIGYQIQIAHPVHQYIWLSLANLSFVAKE